MKTQKPTRTTGDIETTPQWLRINEAVRLFGLSRSTLYILMKADRIRSRNISLSEGKQGTRLIEFASLKTFIENSEKSVEKTA